MAKKKRKDKKPAPPPVKVSSPSLQRIMNLLKNVNQAIFTRDTYMTGLREGLGVPLDWPFDVKLGAFVPPKK